MNLPAAAPENYTVEEVADLLRCQPEKVYRLCARDELVSFKVGGRRLIAKSDLDEYIDRLKGRRVATVTPITTRR